MVGVLEEEQVQDDKTDVWCLAELDKNKDDIKATETTIGELEAAVDEARDAIATVTTEIEELKTGLVDLDKSVAEATEQRKKEHEESINTAAANSAAVELLGMAKNRMNKFYNPSLYKEAPKKEEEDFVQEEEASFAQTRAGQPGPAPETFGEYKKSEGSSSIIAMMDQMIKDTEMDIAEGKRDEEEGQKDYEESMSDAATKREDDSKLIVTKEGEKAEQVAVLEDLKETAQTKKGALTVLEDQVASLHKTCDYLVEKYAEIKEARKKEEEGLKASKMVLAGAKLGFLQH